MPAISMFYGIIVYMFFSDTGQHNKPHIHVEYGGYNGVYSIDDIEVIKSSLPRKQNRLVLAWIELHQEELMANWNLAVRNEPIFKIQGF